MSFVTRIETPSHTLQLKKRYGMHRICSIHFFQHVRGQGRHSNQLSYLQLILNKVNSPAKNSNLNFALLLTTNLLNLDSADY